MRFILALLPWLELFTLIKLGVETTALTSIAYVLVTAFVGMAVLKQQGAGMVNQMRQAQDGRVLGPQLLLDDMAMGFAGILLIVPGMITDVAAIFVAIGPLRRRLVRLLGGQTPEAYQPARDVEAQVTIEGTYRRVDDDNVS